MDVRRTVAIVTCLCSFVTKRIAGKNRAILGLAQGSETVFVCFKGLWLCPRSVQSVPILPPTPHPGPFHTGIGTELAPSHSGIQIQKKVENLFILLTVSPKQSLRGSIIHVF